MKFHENPSNGIPAVPRGRTDGQNIDGGRDMKTLIVAVRNFANASKNCYIILVFIVNMFILII